MYVHYCIICKQFGHSDVLCPKAVWNYRPFSVNQEEA